MYLAEVSKCSGVISMASKERRKKRKRRRKKRKENKRSVNMYGFVQQAIAPGYIYVLKVVLCVCKSGDA